MAAAAALGLAACGGGERQDADEPEGTYQLEVVDATFPAEQSIAERSTLKIAIRNAESSKTIPNVAVTIETAPETTGGAPGSFAQTRDDPGLADPSRPVWILDQGPRGGETAYTNTWALGSMRPNETKTFEWRVTAVKAGTFKVDYSVAPGLDGKAKIASGGKGSFDVTVDDTPPNARVDEDGRVVRSSPE